MLPFCNGSSSKKKVNNFLFDNGAIIKGDTSSKVIALVFTGHEFADGADVITSTLKKHKIKASFFLTGDFYRNPNFSSILKKLADNKHYLGAHSDKHLLYCDWIKRDSLLVTKEEFILDVTNNYKEISKFTSEFPKFFMPPYEWYNKKISDWTKELGLTLINYSPGTSSNGDYTIPVKGERYYSSDSIYNKIVLFEKNNKNHLNGFILLSHIGTDHRRTDKFYNRLDQLISEMKSKGYKFVRIDELLN